MVPTGTGKPGKWEGIFQSGNFVKTGKVREICQPVIVKTLQIYYQTLKNTVKLKMILEKSGKFSF